MARSYNPHIVWELDAIALLNSPTAKSEIIAAVPLRQLRWKGNRETVNLIFH